MFTEITTLNGALQLIRTATIIRFRPTFGSYEPTKATVVTYANQILYSADKPEKIASNIGNKLSIAKLSTPNKLSLYIDAAKVIDIAEPIPEHHHPRARSVIRLIGRNPAIRAQLRETVKQARSKIDKALDQPDVAQA